MMNKIVQEYLKKMEHEERQRLEKDKAKLARRLDLWEMEYSPDNEYSDVYCEAEIVNGEFRYGKKIPIILTDEEYELLLKTDHTNDAICDEKNGVSGLLLVLSVLVWIGGFMAGFATVEEIAISLVIWSSAFLSGSLLLGFAEVIKLLTAIKNK